MAAHRDAPWAAHGAQPVERRRPLRSLAQADGVVVAVGVTEAQHQPPGGLQAHRVDELFLQQPHGRRAQDYHPLLVQADHPLVGAQIEHRREIQVLERHRLGWGSFHHGSVAPF
jgi:hypothetical protein